MSKNGKKFSSFVNKIKDYHFEWKHLLVLFIVLIFFQIIISFIHKISLDELQNETQDWYKRDSAEKIASLTTTSIELLLETSNVFFNPEIDYQKDMVQAFNIIYSQQLLQENIEELYVLVSLDHHIFAIKDGNDLFKYFFSNQLLETDELGPQNQAVKIYSEKEEYIRQTEQIYTQEEGGHTFHVFVPLVPNGEYAGAVYLKISPDFSFINKQVVASYDQTAFIFSALILFGLLAMFYISSYTVKERDETQKMLFREREQHLREQINFQKETLFTKRIYHTHHKAEKIMGFIKEDIHEFTPENLSEFKERVYKYANFVSRVIYDMKWYDPPVQTIRGNMFRTDLNKVVRFLVENLFQRVSENVKRIQFQMDLDETLPVVHINENVVWEIIEPLIQNSIDHSNTKNLEIKISTKYNKEDSKALLTICDNGQGIRDEFLQPNDAGTKKLFLENVSTKRDANSAGYGCYLSYEIARRCGWRLDAFNQDEGGCCFIISMEIRS